MTLEQLIESGFEIWVSITELRVCDLKIPATKGHDYEWLALGKILKSSIEKVMPYDGNIVHVTKPNRIVYSLGSPEPWFYDWEKWMWRYDADKAAIARVQYPWDSKGQGSKVSKTGRYKRIQTLAKDIKKIERAKKREKQMAQTSNEGGEDERLSKRQKVTQTSDERVEEHTAREESPTISNQTSQTPDEEPSREIDVPSTTDDLTPSAESELATSTNEELQAEGVEIDEQCCPTCNGSGRILQRPRML
jgi:hypothetical protein